MKLCEYITALCVIAMVAVGSLAQSGHQGAATITGQSLEHTATSSTVGLLPGSGEDSTTPNPPSTSVMTVPQESTAVTSESLTSVAIAQSTTSKLTRNSPATFSVAESVTSGAVSTVPSMSRFMTTSQLTSTARVPNGTPSQTSTSRPLATTTTSPTNATPTTLDKAIPITPNDTAPTTSSNAAPTTPPSNIRCTGGIASSPFGIGWVIGFAIGVLLTVLVESTLCLCCTCTRQKTKRYVPKGGRDGEYIEMSSEVLKQHSTVQQDKVDNHASETTRPLIEQ